MCTQLNGINTNYNCNSTVQYIQVDVNIDLSGTPQWI